MEMSSFREKYKLEVVPVAVSGKRLQLYCVSNWDIFVDKLAQEGEEYIENFPFWVKIWEASVVLADHLVRIGLGKKKEILEIGAGMGVTGLFLGAFGHTVTVTDYEEEALELMTEVDDCRARLKRLREGVATKEQELAKLEVQVARRDKELEGIVAQKKGERDKVAGGIDAESLAAYERVLRCRGWPALVPARDGSCGGCFMSVTGQTLNLLLLGKELVFCQSCSRILYVEEAEADRVLKKREAV
ncbi:MAG: hypothetical protein JSV01_02865 [Desulfobacterales bacterium]|nr:MAG: hypothetical protein JSV01_02865 [Desulfobacterales bacterium]